MNGWEAVSHPLPPEELELFEEEEDDDEEEEEEKEELDVEFKSFEEAQLSSDETKTEPIEASTTETTKL